MAALGEIAWSAPKKNYDGFIDRLQRLVDVYRAEGYNYSKVIYNLNHAFTPDTAAHAITATLTTIDHAPIHYTLNGATPTKDAPLYTAPLSIDKSCTLRAAAFRAWGATPVLEQTFHFSQSTACPITLLQPSAGGYSYNGAPLLVNGVWGNDTNFKSGHWLGFNGTDLEAVIDLGKLTSVSRAAIHCIVEKGYWIFDARAFEVSVSTDGSTYQPVAVEQYAAATEQTPNEVVTHTLQFAPTPARYVKVKVTSEHSNPAWHPGKGYAGFLFVDEVEID